MPKGIKTKETLMKQQKRAIEAFKEWNKEKYPVFDSKGNQLVLHDDEVFVPVFNYTRKKRDKEGNYLVKVPGKRAYKRVRYKYELNRREQHVLDPAFDFCYYVSNYANVLSFKFIGTNKPLLMTQAENDKGYMQVSDSWRVHKVVWFSFMADAIKKKAEDPDAVLPYNEALHYNYEIKTLNDLKKLCLLSDNEIHHIDVQKDNNRLNNLEALQDRVHDLITYMNKVNDDKDKLEMLVSAYEFLDKDKDSFFITDDDLILALTIDHQDLLSKLTPEAKNEALSMYWHKASLYVFAVTFNFTGIDFFAEDKNMLIEVNNTICYFRVSIIDDEINITKLKLTDEVNEADIICDNGDIYLPKYKIA